MIDYLNEYITRLSVLKKRRIWDKEAVGEQEDEFSFIQGKHDDISLSIEYNETGLSEICESARTKDMVNQPEESVGRLFFK